jgi:hypothetical protein
VDNDLDRHRIKRTWPKLTYYTRTYVKGLSKTIKALLWLVFLWTVIWTRDISKNKYGCFPLYRAFWSTLNYSPTQAHLIPAHLITLLMLIGVLRRSIQNTFLILQYISFALSQISPRELFKNILIPCSFVPEKYCES